MRAGEIRAAGGALIAGCALSSTVFDGYTELAAEGLIQNDAPVKNETEVVSAAAPTKVLGAAHVHPGLAAVAD